MHILHIETLTSGHTLSGSPLPHVHQEAEIKKCEDIKRETNTEIYE